ncbi:ZIP zinc transporter family protein [hydrothermal vent metagenome]|uniref:ZIP zinc transporter family protein n=1 Tax=hydrothermal vent metagenome TaxID=652676 RepID=A0A3B0ZSI1_9ZZZZ
MNNIETVILYSLFSGLPIFIGALISKFDFYRTSELKDEILHSIIAFGGGILISAVALVLIPHGTSNLSLLILIPVFILGSVVFFIIDRKLEQKSGDIAQLMAMLMDFIPEALALGAVFSQDTQLGLLLAIFIGLQNLPEGFNSYKELLANGYSASRSLAILFPLSFTGVIASSIGFIYFKDSPQTVSAVMVFAAGGILYLTFQDIAPKSKMNNHWSPALGASLGFLVGIIGQKIIT